MKLQVKNYSFNKTTKEVTFSDYETIDLDGVLLITNVTSNAIIYNFAKSGGVVSGNVLTLDYDTSEMADTDDLQIFYDDPAFNPATAEKQLPNNHGVTVINFPGTQPISGTVTIANPTANPETGLATEDTLQKAADKIPTYDLYISYNEDGTVNQKIWKEEGTETVVKTLTYNYSGGNLISKILS
ncbi:TPA: hypothetical protein DEB29_03455 [Candidatus Wolfebacteria bacterium]|nr:hypothetical protein [Candidatus Wolfebacteria bacterium]